MSLLAKNIHSNCNPLRLPVCVCGQGRRGRGGYQGGGGDNSGGYQGSAPSSDSTGGYQGGGGEFQRGGGDQGSLALALAAVGSKEGAETEAMVTRAAALALAAVGSKEEAAIRAAGRAAQCRVRSDCPATGPYYGLSEIP